MEEEGWTRSKKEKMNVGSSASPSFYKKFEKGF